MKISDYLYATVAYADVFDYPLTEDDLYYWCIKQTPGKNVHLSAISGVRQKNYLLFLKNRESILESSSKRAQAAKEKWEIARSVGRWLQYIPTIFLIGVTGGVAVNNAAPDDDIDLFFITAKRTLWISRLLVVLMLDLIGRRRKPADKKVKNKICVNMFMSEEAMTVTEGERDLFSAHEVLQMEPLWSRRNTYWRFLQANRWVSEFLPVAWSIKNVGRNQHPKISHWWTRLSRKFFRLFEAPAKFFQLWYMASRRSHEVISDGVLRFHPKDARVWIKKDFAKRLRVKKIPLDNVFYGS